MTPRIRWSTERASVGRGGLIALSTLVVGCTALLGPTPSPFRPTPPPVPSVIVAPSQAVATPFPLRSFPIAVTGPLPASFADGLQEVLEAAVEGHANLGIGAAVIAATPVTNSARGTAGRWSGVAGQDRTGKVLAADARFETGSIGKTVVAAEILRLVEQGRLDLDDLAADHFGPDVRRDTNGATVRDLLRMRSGLTNGQPPGTRFEYSNGDYVLLGLVLEGVEGRPLGDVLTDDILKVPGAEGLTFPAGGTVENAAGPLETDPLSLARWGYELFGGEILTDESLASMVAFTKDGYGMGAFDFSVDFGVPAAGHLGQEDAWSAGLVALPDRQTVFVALMNSSDVERTLRILTQLAAVPID